MYANMPVDPTVGQDKSLDLSILSEFQVGTALTQEFGLDKAIEGW